MPCDVSTQLLYEGVGLVLRSRQFPTFVLNSSKKFWTRINSYPASWLGTVSKRVGDPRLVEAVGDSR